MVGGGAWYAMMCVPEPEAGEFVSDRREWICSRERAAARRCLKTTVRRQDSSARKPRGPSQGRHGNSVRYCRKLYSETEGTHLMELAGRGIPVISPVL